MQKIKLILETSKELRGKKVTQNSVILNCCILLPIFLSIEMLLDAHHKGKKNAKESCLIVVSLCYGERPHCSLIGISLCLALQREAAPASEKFPYLKQGFFEAFPYFKKISYILVQ